MPPGAHMPVGEAKHISHGKKVYTIKGQQVEVDRRYDIVKSVGSGAYGTVFSAKDSARNGEPVAIKKIPKVFDDLTDGKRILREIKLLRFLRHENIMGVLELMRPRDSMQTFQDLYMVCELMDTDLHQVIKSKQPLTEEHVKYFAFQLMRACKYMHQAGVIHRDIKPGNLLVNENCDLKLCDFGLARGGVEAMHPQGLELTDYVVTRWYRPPELLLMSNYAASIDIWSSSCIIGEMFNRKPLFPGRDYIHQLTIITDWVGTPERGDLDFVKSEDALRFLRNMQRKKSRAMAELIPKAPRDCLSLIESMMVFHPERRITADAALRHPWFASLYDPEDDMDYVPDPRIKMTWEFDYRDVREPELRKLFWEEIVLYHPHPSPP
eukprot:TRINITY_DN1851_c0_g1_i1.p1 TRINITY_DN1851_c0_g1~~TRINITY_DN1851_c0_g1_i1.p1  ORF type:complete len:380 (+),score=84.80 TRINITY_DN1851_c0_g1_i1:101-1240(+)